MNNKFKTAGSIDPQALVVEDRLGKAIYTNKVGPVASVFYDEKDPTRMDYLCAIFSHAHEMQKVLKMLIDYDIDIEDVQTAAYKILLSIKNEYPKFVINIDKDKEEKYLNLFGGGKNVYNSK